MPLPTVSPSERSFNPQTVCVWETGLFIARWYNPSVPASEQEVIALAGDSGVSDWWTDGRANFTRLAAGMEQRYGLTGTVIEGAAAAQAAVLAAVAAGPCAIGLAGDQLNLTPHWQDVSVGHAIAVFYPPGSGTTGIQLDPLAPQDYRGDPFPADEMATFTTAAIIFADAPQEEAVTFVALEKFDPPRVWSLIAPATVIGYEIDMTSLAATVGLSKLWTASSSAQADQRIQVPGNVAYLHVIDGVYAGLWVAEDGHAVLQPPPVGGGFTQAQVDAAIKAATDPLNARIAAIKAKVALGASDISDD